MRTPVQRQLVSRTTWSRSTSGCAASARYASCWSNPSASRRASSRSGSRSRDSTRLSARAVASTVVVAPVPWVPFRSARFGRYGELSRQEEDELYRHYGLDLASGAAAGGRGDDAVTARQSGDMRSSAAFSTGESGTTTSAERASEGSARGVAIADGVAYVAAEGGGLHVVDVTDAARPRVLATALDDLDEEPVAVPRIERAQRRIDTRPGAARRYGARTDAAHALEQHVDIVDQ